MIYKMWKCSICWNKQKDLRELFCHLNHIQLCVYEFVYIYNAELVMLAVWWTWSRSVFSCCASNQFSSQHFALALLVEMTLLMRSALYVLLWKVSETRYRFIFCWVRILDYG